jgi:hypothetical protein
MLRLFLIIVLDRSADDNSIWGTPCRAYSRSIPFLSCLPTTISYTRSPSPACQHRRVGVQFQSRHQHPHARTTIRSCDGEVFGMARILSHLRRLKKSCLDALSSRLTHWTKPLVTSLPLATLTDLGRSKSELVAENALLRQQLIILRRQVKRPAYTKTDRMFLVLLARLVRTWNQALLIVQPETLLRWHRELFRLYWKRRSKTSSHNPKVASETIALIRQIAKDNRLWELNGSGVNS